jgi:extracellular elastinolytic metalloproteinase
MGAMRQFRVRHVRFSTVRLPIWIRAIGLAALVALMLAHPAGRAQAVTASETVAGIAGPGTQHRGNGVPLQLPNANGMPATVADFLAGSGRSPATVNSLHLQRDMPFGSAGRHVLDFSQQIQGLQVYGAGAKAIFDQTGALLTLQENLAPAGPVQRATVGPQAALNSAIAVVHPGLNVSLSSKARSGATVEFGDDAFFFRNPRVTRVVVPSLDGTLREGFLVETWSRSSNQLSHTLVDGSGQVLRVQDRTANDSYNVFKLNPSKTAQSVEQGAASGDPNSPDGWLDSGSQTSIDISGNNVRAYLDANGNDAPDSGGSTVSDGNFLSPANRLADPTAVGNREAAIQSLFYINNVAHDELYGFGFTESWRNFQQLNFDDGGSGGSDGDPVLAEAQDGGGTNNANFATPPDGSSGRMQMYLWDGVLRNEYNQVVGHLNYAYAADLVIGEFDADNDVQEQYLAADALFGPPLTTTGVTAELQDVGGSGCNAANFPNVAGKIAVVDRGGCAFTAKALNAQDKGAVGLIVVNLTSSGDALIQMGGDATGDGVTIPLVLLGVTDGSKIKATVAAHPGTSATLRNNPAGSRDGDVDADIVRHEYAHGLSWRLIGNMDGMMGGSMGEGLSDVYAGVMTNDGRIGEYAYADPKGIRTAPYDNYLADTGRVYESFTGELHSDGEIIAAALWDMWARYRDDLSLTGVTGTLQERQSRMMTDLVDGMKVTLHQCEQPTYTTLRDGVLRAIGGTADPNGAPQNQERWCHAWRAFAKYGLGENATTNCALDPYPGIPYLTVLTWNWVDGFDVPEQCNTLGELPTASISTPSDGLTVNQGDNISFTGTANDPDDGNLTAKIFWVSDRDGEFGRGSSVSTSSLSAGTHEITASVTDSAGNSSSETILVTVNSTSPDNQPPQASFDVVTDGLTATFTDTSTDPDGSIVAWAWDFDTDANLPGDSSSQQNPSFTYPAAGLYNVQLTVTDNEGATRVTTRTVRVEEGSSNQSPTANAGTDQTVADSDGQPGETVDLNGSASSDSDGSIASYAWTWTGGSASGATPSVTLPDGVTVVTLTVTDDAGATGTDTVTVTVEAPATPNNPPTANAGADQTVADSDSQPGEQFTLDGSSSSDGDGTIVSYQWSWGAGGNASGVTPSVTLPDGITVVTLTVTDNDGATDTDTVTITVEAPVPNNPPTANAGTDQTVADSDSAPGETVNLNGSASSDSDGTVDSYAWSWAGGSASGATPSVPLPDGVTVVTLTVTDDDGATGTDTVTVTVEAPAPNNPPVADAGPDIVVPASGKGPSASASITLNGTGSSDPDGDSLTYAWIDGNGMTVGNQAMVTLPLGKGVYTFTLLVSDGQGQDQDSVCVEVYNKNSSGACGGSAGTPPNASFSYSVTDQTVDFTDQSSDADGSVTGWSWNFGDGSGTSNLQNPQHVYTSPGTYTVTLTVIDDSGLSDTTAQDVTLAAGPGGGISLSASGYKEKGLQKATLTWSGATSANVDVYRDGVLLLTTANAGAYLDNIDAKGSGSYTYRVCEAGTSPAVCSSDVVVAF